MSSLRSLLVSALVLLGSSVLADTVTLRDGTVRDGTIVAEDDETVTMEVRMGGLKGKIVIPRYEIASVKSQPLPPDPVEVAAAKLRKDAEAAVGKESADAWVKLGDLYAQNSGYSAQAKAAYEKAIAADPEHVRARHGLGHIKTAQGWQKTDDLRRERGLVPLGEVWVRPDERSWLIDKRHNEQTDELSIGPRQPDDFSRAEVARNLALKRAADDARQQDADRLAAGQSLLSQYGYYTNGGSSYIGGTWADGVGIESPGYSFFVGTVGTGSGWYGGSGYGPRVYGGDRGGHGGGRHGGGGGGGPGGGGYRQPHGYSPGFRTGNFSFGTSLSPYGYGGSGGWGGGGGWGVQLNGGSGSTRWNVNMGGFSGSSSYRSSTGIGGFGF